MPKDFLGFQQPRLEVEDALTGAQPRAQLEHVERLDEKVVNARVKPLGPILLSTAWM